MYQDYFNFKQEPFSIAPDPHFLFMSRQHKEALAHLIYGIQSSGAFVVLSGEVGSGKTTVCRCFLEQVPENVDIAFILNPKLSAKELLASICDELSVAYESDGTTKHLIDVLNRFLLENHAKGRSTVVIIEEAQNLSVDVLEQLRLLTNLETSEKKLLQIVLLAQPEFLETLQQNNMRQLAQRITARFHLLPLSKRETLQYIHHRLAVAGAKLDPFPKTIKKSIYQESAGVPRLINLIADRCLLGAYASNKTVVTKVIFNQAIKELKGESPSNKKYFNDSNVPIKITLITLALLASLTLIYFGREESNVQEFINEWVYGENLILNKISNKTEFQYNNNNFLIDDLVSMQHENIELRQQDFISATRVLSTIWNLSVNEPVQVNGPKSLCSFANELGLECISEQGNIGLLLKLGRPAILKFVDENSQPYYGVLLGIAENSLIFQFSDKKISFSFQQLEKIWLGEFYLFAKMPPEWNGKVLQPGDKARLTSWIEMSLDQFQTQESLLEKLTVSSHDQSSSFPLLDEKVFNETLVQRVKNIQNQAGIHADGIVGIKTIIFINTLVDKAVPRLEGIAIYHNNKKGLE
jgi:general secretion pathway protein A